MLETGNGERIDYEQAIKYYRKAADAGHPLAQTNLAKLMRVGKGAMKNPEEAANFFEKAAKSGNTEAMGYFGEMLMVGEGIDKNAALGRDFIEKAAAADEPVATAWMGEFALADGRTKEGVELIKKSADEENPKGLFDLGFLTMMGFGVEKNLKDGAELIKDSADSPFSGPDQQFILSELYAEGVGVEENQEFADQYSMRGDKSNGVPLCFEYLLAPFMNGDPETTPTIDGAIHLLLDGNDNDEKE